MLGFHLKRDDTFGRWSHFGHFLFEICPPKEREIEALCVCAVVWLFGINEIEEWNFRRVLWWGWVVVTVLTRLLLQLKNDRPHPPHVLDVPRHLGVELAEWSDTLPLSARGDLVSGFQDLHLRSLGRGSVGLLEFGQLKSENWMICFVTVYF